MPQGRVGPLGLTLLLLAVACSMPKYTETSLGDGVSIEVYASAARMRRPGVTQVRVTLRNRGPHTRTFRWPQPHDVAPCGAPEGKGEPLEVWFSGFAYTSDFSRRLYRWKWTPPRPTALTLVLSPGDELTLADVTFHPPPDAAHLAGVFCIRVYGNVARGGPVYEGLRR